MSLPVGIICGNLPKDPVLAPLKAELVHNFGSQATSKFHFSLEEDKLKFCFNLTAV